MTMYADKSQKNGKQSIANEAVRKTDSREQSGQFADNRPVAFAQRKAKQAMNLHTTRQNPVIQRLTGMEVELGIPFYKTIPEQSDAFKKNESSLSPKDRKDMGSFLWGGLKYGIQYGVKPGLFDISADHNPFLIAHNEFVEYLVDNEFVTDLKYDLMTNMEYRTAPFEERDPASQSKFENMVSMVQEHANDAVTKAISNRTSDLSDPVSDKHTGIPYDSFERLLRGDANGLHVLETVKDAINPSVYYQTTTGALPSEIPALFEQAAQDIANTRPAPKSRDYISKEILETSVRMAAYTMKDRSVAIFLGSFTEGERRSLQGWLTLICQYLLANSVDTTEYAYQPSDSESEMLIRIGGTNKNMVPYLSKTKLLYTGNALPERIRPDKSKKGWRTLFEVLLMKLESPEYCLIDKLELKNYIGEYYRDGETTEIVKNQTIGGTPQEWLLNLLDGVDVPHVITGNKLTLDEQNKKFSPKLTIKGEQAIPLEDRKTNSKSSFRNLLGTEKIEQVLSIEWEKANSRRMDSTVFRTEFKEKYLRIRNSLSRIESLSSRINDLKGYLKRFNRGISEDPYDIWSENANLSEFEVILHDDLVRIYNKIYVWLKSKSIELSMFTSSLETNYGGFITDLDAANIGKNASDNQLIQSLEHLIVLSDAIENAIPQAYERFQRSINNQLIQIKTIINGDDFDEGDRDVFAEQFIELRNKVIKTKIPSLSVLKELNKLYFQLQSLWEEINAEELTDLDL